MTAPSAVLRAAVYSRDLNRCVHCGTGEGLSFQHRVASGMGGRGKKAPPLSAADGLTACLSCNQRFESDLQERALASGWKVRKFTKWALRDIPYLDGVTGLWWLADDEGFRHQVTRAEAFARLVGCGNIRNGQR